MNWTVWIMSLALVEILSRWHLLMVNMALSSLSLTFPRLGSWELPGPGLPYRRLWTGVAVDKSLHVRPSRLISARQQWNCCGFGGLCWQTGGKERQGAREREWERKGKKGKREGSGESVWRFGGWRGIPRTTFPVGGVRPLLPDSLALIWPTWSQMWGSTAGEERRNIVLLSLCFSLNFSQNIAPLFLCLGTCFFSSSHFSTFSSLLKKDPEDHQAWPVIF